MFGHKFSKCKVEFQQIKAALFKNIADNQDAQKDLYDALKTSFKEKQLAAQPKRAKM